MTRQIYSVDTIDLTASGDEVRVAVQGRVNTSGWSNIRLVPAKEHADPFNELKLDVLIAGPRGQEWRVPAFWSGGGRPAISRFG